MDSLTEGTQIDACGKGLKKHRRIQLGFLATGALTEARLCAGRQGPEVAMRFMEAFYARMSHSIARGYVSLGLKMGEWITS